MEARMNIYGVITTIQPPTACVDELARRLQPERIPLIVVGDRKGPTSYPSWSRFLPIEKQYELPFSLAKLLPEKHYARKNLGYLLAFSEGATSIYETDDDNNPNEFWKVQPESTVTAPLVTGADWVNIYKYYSNLNIWPRGLALDHIRQSGTLTEAREVFCPVRQNLANGSPDVDAIWRLVLDQDVTFKKTGPIALDTNAWCPFNSQNTWWSKEAFPLMYLPSFVSFRMTDIWRSFVAQRCLWAMGAHLLFNDADAFQSRNEHNLMKDFADEVPGYLNNSRISDALASLKLANGPSHTLDNVSKCYEALIRIGLVPEKEMPLVDAWANDCQRLL